MDGPVAEGRMVAEPDPEAFPDTEELTALVACDRFRRLADHLVAPHIPQSSLVGALVHYLDLCEDEVLLALLSTRKRNPPRLTCALTTRRVYWLGAAGGGGGRVRGQSLAYVDLPESIERSGGRGFRVDLGGGRQITLGATPRLGAALVDFLREMRSVALGEGSAAVPGFRIGRAREEWPAVVAADRAARVIHAEVRTFQASAMRTKRPRVTSLLVGVCVAVYLMMLLHGGDGISPSTDAMVNWGANFGPKVVFEGESWRLVTCQFLHFGPVHLGMNVWCLASLGAAIERFYGRTAFAALYLLSGFGGAIASLWAHPMAISAGASGAVFGVMGALIGFLAVRRGEVPLVLLRPMWAGALAFLGYNLLFGLAIPQIDMAAHLGGLATGFLCGLVLAGRVPDGAGLLASLRRPAATLVIAAGLGFLLLRVEPAAREQMLEDADLGPLVRGAVEAGPAWNAFVDGLGSALAGLDDIERRFGRTLAAVQRGDARRDDLNRDIDGLIADSDTLGERIAVMSTEMPELVEMLETLDSARNHQAEALKAVRRYLRTGDESHLSGPDGYGPSLEHYREDLDELERRRDAYFRKYELQAAPSERPPSVGPR